MGSRCDGINELKAKGLWISCRGEVCGRRGERVAGWQRPPVSFVFFSLFDMNSISGGQSLKPRV